MSLGADSLGALACPGCAGALSVEGATGVRCAGCGRHYPIVDGIACLVPDPRLWQAQWRGRLDAFGATLDGRVERLRAEAALPGLLPRTRARVMRVADALVHERGRVRAFADLLEPAPTAPAPGTLLPMRAGEQDARAVLECDEHVFRDWAWGRDEVDRLRAFAEHLFPERVETLAAYGVGAGRLAVDAHRSLGPRRTFGLDSNPLPMWTAARLLRGETVESYEFPLWPSRDEDVVVRRQLRTAEAAPPGFCFLIADALQPPFAPASLDAVLTAWFIDAAHADFREVATRVNRSLRLGGLWINVGPLRIKENVLRAYSIEEVHELVERGGFDLLARERQDLPYFAHPLGGTRALETVFGFAARKNGEAPEVERASASPPWLLDPRVPVEGTPGMVRVQQASIVAAGIISLVDGTRSLSDIAKVVADTWKVDPADLEPQLRTFFASTEVEG